jgi:hypothetical protein
MDAERGHALADRHHGHQCILGPGPPRLRIGHAAPQINDRAPVRVDADRGADFAALREVGLKGPLRALEIGVAQALDHRQAHRLRSKRMPKVRGSPGRPDTTGEMAAVAVTYC